MTTEYCIAEASEPDDLVVAVTAKIAEGWQPWGGVSVAVYHDRWTNERKGYDEYETVYAYAQAMTRRTGHPSGSGCPRCYGGPDGETQ